MKKFAAVAFLLFVFHFSFSQGHKFEKTPLCNFLRQNFDSTIVLNYAHNGNDFQMISKWDSFTAYFSYYDPFKWSAGYTFPLALKYKFLTEDDVFRNTDPDTNRYFIPHKVDYRLRNQNWINIDQFNLWNLKDDKSDTCHKKCTVMDGSVYELYLITKTEIKKLYFDNPDFYEECCPGNKDRQTVLAVLKIFESTFPSRVNGVSATLTVQ
ncbi:hypothetical protein [Pinibacter soli]|uniref:DUF4136 domain-containing protein n=1 Tax=Pinibacter soli TaxID=3044211 RepID=A0ABT6R8B3_9BACT|nr:hypothetical protein [Pinibacter soli]MDI3318800.1 hypothetical protein [Pinibacter soli]